MTGYAAFPSLAGARGTGSFEGIPAVERQILEQITLMTGSYHEPVVHRKLLFGWNVLEPVVPGAGSGGRLPASSQSFARD